MQGNQYAVTEYYTPVHKGDASMPAVWFVYDISPISVSIARARRSLAHLAVRSCAVVGGVFAVTGARAGRPHAAPHAAHTGTAQCVRFRFGAGRPSRTVALLSVTNLPESACCSEHSAGLLSTQSPSPCRTCLCEGWRMHCFSTCKSTQC